MKLYVKVLMGVLVLSVMGISCTPEPEVIVCSLSPVEMQAVNTEIGMPPFDSKENMSTQHCVAGLHVLLRQRDGELNKVTEDFKKQIKVLEEIKRDLEQCRGQLPAPPVIPGLAPAKHGDNELKENPPSSDPRNTGSGNMLD